MVQLLNCPGNLDIWTMNSEGVTKYCSKLVRRDSYVLESFLDM